jgi:ABC-type sugar transport system ATPase subunit
LYKTETESCISGKVKIVEDNGTYQIITTQIGALDIKSRAPESMEITYGDIVWLHLNQDKIKFFKEGKKFPLQPINQKSSNMEEY